MNSKEILIPIHQIMQTHISRVVWFDQVEKISSKFVKQVRYLAITTPAIFLLKKRVFPTVLCLSRMISISDIKQVSLTDHSVFFYGSSVKMEICHPRFIEIAAAVISLSTSLFTKPMILASQEQKDRIVSANFEFETSSKAADRFVSYCSLLPSPIPIDQINEICKLLIDSPRSVTFSADICASVVIGPLVSAISSDPSISTLSLSLISFSSFLPFFTNLLNSDSFIENISFSSVSFNSTLPSLSAFFRDQMKAPITTLSFSKCDLSAPSFRSFFEDLCCVNTGIHSLSFESCSATDKSLDSVFFAIFDSPCFKTLRSLSLGSLPSAQHIQILVIQLLNCDWILKGHFLNSIRITNMDISVDFILPIVTVFDSGLDSLIFKKCQFLTALPKIKSFHGIKLDLSEVAFTPESLVSLFEAVSASEAPPQTLLLDSLRIQAIELSRFYHLSKSARLNGVLTLSWANNDIGDDSYSDFVEFLSSQTSLVDLSISNSFRSTNPVEGIRKIVECLPLERLIICGAGMHSFGPEFCSVIKEISKKGTVKSLDVTGHRLNDEGLKSLAEVAVGGIKAVAYGGIESSNPDGILDLIDTIIQSKIEFSVWPSEDLKRSIAKVNIALREKYVKREQQLKSHFEQKFGPVSEVNTKLRRENSLQRNVSKSASNEVLPVCIGALRDPETTELLKECLGGNFEKRDPIVSTMESINEDTSVEKLCHQIH